MSRPACQNRLLGDHHSFGRSPIHPPVKVNPQDVFGQRNVHDSGTYEWPKVSLRYINNSRKRLSKGDRYGPSAGMSEYGCAMLAATDEEDSFVVFAHYIAFNVAMQIRAIPFLPDRVINLNEPSHFKGNLLFCRWAEEAYAVIGSQLVLTRGRFAYGSTVPWHLPGR